SRNAAGDRRRQRRYRGEAWLDHGRDEQRPHDDVGHRRATTPVDLEALACRAGERANDLRPYAGINPRGARCGNVRCGQSQDFRAGGGGLRGRGDRPRRGATELSGVTLASSQTTSRSETLRGLLFRHEGILLFVLAAALIVLALQSEQFLTIDNLLNQG